MGPLRLVALSRTSAESATASATTTGTEPRFAIRTAPRALAFGCASPSFTRAGTRMRRTARSVPGAANPTELAATNTSSAPPTPRSVPNEYIAPSSSTVPTSPARRRVSCDDPEIRVASVTRAHREVREVGGDGIGIGDGGREDRLPDGRGRAEHQLLVEKRERLVADSGS